MKKLAIFAAALLAVIFIARQAVMPKLAERGFERMASQRVGVNPMANLEDGLHVYICGAGSPLADPKRSGPCIGVIAGKKLFVFDAGTNGSQNLGQMGFPLVIAEEIFLTHLHSDHLDGLGQMLLGTWVLSPRKSPTKVSGPVGTSQIVDGINMTYQIDSTYRTAHHGAAIANPSSFGAVAREIDVSSGSKIVYDKDGVKITAFKVSHEPVSPAFGYRVDYKGRSVAISGDTAYDPNIAVAAKDVDVLFHEALNMEMVKTMESAAKANGVKGLEKVLFDIQDYHTSPVDAAKTAKQAGATDLVLYHIVPMLPSDALIPMFVKGTADEFEGKITVSEDGTIVRLPAGSDTIAYEYGL
jgi:ribonuclease Z